MKKLTVSYTPTSSPSEEVPQIRMRGKWLAQAGFPVGVRFTATIENGKLILSPLHEARA